MKLRVGPGALVAAAFIGPGTVTTCTLAGAQFGFALLWALVFAAIATVILQEMAGRLGAGARLGLGEAIRQQITSPWLGLPAILLAVIAIGVGNAAYQAGNLTGASLGVEALLNTPPDRKLIITGIAAIAGALLLFGGYAIIERLLIVFVLIMAISFLVVAIAVRPDLGSLLAGLKPSIPEGGTLTALALVGTTIVPYNLFLHASAARTRWADHGGVAAARTDTAISVGVGGLISILILMTAASTLFLQQASVTNGADMARALEPVFGGWARYLIGVGLLAAGITSAITAPLAAGYAVSELFAKGDNQRLIFRCVSVGILLIGVALTWVGGSPTELIVTAQAANGIVLPVIAIFLVFVMNNKALLGEHANGLVSNILGGTICLVAVGIGARGLARAFGLI